MHAGDYPGSQAGVADMFAYDEDQQDWYPAGYWLWNLRGQIAANLSSGNFSLNLPIFSMYLNDLPAIESWTSAQMGGLAGACVPETMRFNGNGYYNGGTNSQNASCATASSPSYNAEDITSGAEIALWIWQQYEDTGSLSFLQTVLPAHGADRRVPARLPEGRLGRLPARRRQRARDPVGGAGPDHRPGRRPGPVPRRRQRRHPPEHRLLPRHASSRPPRARSSPTPAPTRRRCSSCSTRSRPQRPRPPASTPAART